MEREAPYVLPVELARGTLHRLRNQLAAWETSGLPITDAIRKPLSEAQHQLSLSCINQRRPAEAAQHAEASLTAGNDAVNALCAAYAEFAGALRRRQAVKQNQLFAINLGSAPLGPAVMNAALPACNAAVVPMEWRTIEPSEGERDWTQTDKQIEWCHAHGLRVCAGPLIKFDPSAAPDWLCLWDGDLENLMKLASEHLQAVVGRYRGKVHLWQCASRMNVGQFLSLSEEQCLRLTVLAIDTVRRLDPRTPIVMAIDQPWAEFMNRQPCDLSPLYFADTIVRARPGTDRREPGNQSRLLAEWNAAARPDGLQPADRSLELPRPAAARGIDYPEQRDERSARPDAG